MMFADRNKKNSGIALITVMIVVASVSATASWLLYGQNLDTARMTRVLGKRTSCSACFIFGEGSYGYFGGRSLGTRRARLRLLCYFGKSRLAAG